MSSPGSEGVAAFFISYQDAFERYGAAAIADHFGFPCHVTGDADEVSLMSVPDRATWLGVIEQLLSTYTVIGVASARLLDLVTTTLSPRLHQAVAHWDLHDAAGDRLYEFDAVYTLAEVGGVLRIVAIAHNELPRLLACLARQPGG